MPPENFRGGNHASSTVEQFGVENAQSKMRHLSTLHEVSVQQGAIFQGLCCEAEHTYNLSFLVYLQNLGTFTQASNLIESTRISR